MMAATFRAQLRDFLDNWRMKYPSVTIWIIAVGAIILGLISVIIVGAVVFTAVAYNQVPEVLANWGGLIVGFFLGNFFNFMKSALDMRDKEGSDDKKIHNTESH